LLQAAFEAFLEKGYAAATMADIAARMGMLKGSLYHYIETKEDLLFALAELGAEQGEEFVRDQRKLESASPSERVVGFIRSLIVESHKLPQPLQAVVDQELHRLSPKRLATIIERRDRVSAYFHRILEDGIQDGSFRTDLNVSITTNVVFSGVSTMYRWYRPSGSLSLEEIADEFVGLILRGLEARPPRGARKAQAGQTRRA
jgi:AcrR family transcriptional regulator